jgi:hypothetical protein
MKNPTLTEIRKAVEASGGEYKKLLGRLNGQDAYRINGSTLTRKQMILAYKLGLLL